MSNEVEVVDVNDQKLNAELLSAIMDAADGPLNKVAAAGQSYIRRELRENAFSEKIIPHVKVENSDLTYWDTELPVIVEEMEPSSPGAVSLSFNDHPDATFYRRDKFIVYFSKISTPEFTKNTDELRVGKSNIRQIVTDNSLRDIEYTQDKRFIDYIEDICGGAAGATGKAGFQQWFTTSAAITRDSYVDSISHLEDVKLNNGMFLTNRKTANQFVKFGRDEAGGDLSEALMKQGRKALEGGVVMDIPHAFTIKRDLVPDNTVYQFTTPEYLGRAYILEDVTMYVEKKKDILTFSAVKKYGMTIANVAGVAIQDFDDDTDGS